MRKCTHIHPIDGTCGQIFGTRFIVHFISSQKRLCQGAGGHELYGIEGIEYVHLDFLHVQVNLSFS